MSDLIIQARVALKYESESNWISSNPLLLRGEVAAVKINSQTVKFKVGDGAMNFVALPYANDISGLFALHGAVPATNPGAPVGNAIWVTSTAGSYTYFLNNLGNPIVVNSGEFVYLLDNGSYFEKIILPISTAGLATTADLEAGLDAVFNAYYAAKPTRPGQVHLVNKFLRTNNGFYPDPVPIIGNWYVDMEQSFDLSRLSAVWVRNVGAPGPPSIQTDCQIVTINKSGVITFLGAGDMNYGVVGQITVTDLSTQALALSDPAASGDIRCYIAVRAVNAGNDGVTVDNTYIGGEVREYSNAGGNALVTKLTDHDISYQVELFAETVLQSRVNEDAGVANVVTVNTSVTLSGTNYVADNSNRVILFDSTPMVSLARVSLPKWGIKKGKQLVIRTISAAGIPVHVEPIDGALLDGFAAPITLSPSGDVLRVVFDGSNWWSL